MKPDKMWQMFNEAFDVEEDAQYCAWHFGSNKETANKLADLVLKGVKQATASCLWVYDEEDVEVPRKGDYSVITDWDGNALCIVQNVEVTILPFEEVTADFAATEGEGDLSLTYWREVHREFFEETCERLDLEFDESMPVVCEVFEVVFKA